jgi:DNA mismatch endonuclease (patch repair protein)
MDRVTVATRSRIMASVTSRNTKPELIVRRAMHAAGLRYLLHDPRLPGKPDLVFVSRKLTLFVHGCFWHRCPYCRNGAKGVGSNHAYWLPKLARNAERDKETQLRLRKMGWKVRVIWQCQTANETKLTQMVRAIRSIEPARPIRRQ